MSRTDTRQDPTSSSLIQTLELHPDGRAIATGVMAFAKPGRHFTLMSGQDKSPAWATCPFRATLRIDGDSILIESLVLGADGAPAGEHQAPLQTEMFGAISVPAIVRLVRRFMRVEADREPTHGWDEMVGPRMRAARGAVAESDARARAKPRAGGRRRTSGSDEFLATIARQLIDAQQRGEERGAQAALAAAYHVSPKTVNHWVLGARSPERGFLDPVSKRGEINYLRGPRLSMHESGGEAHSAVTVDNPKGESVTTPNSGADE